MTYPRNEWRCFHCSDVFTTETDARHHFGSTEASTPACQIKIAGEFALLDALRNAEDQLTRYRNEDSDILRVLWSTRSDHATELRREEEKGYARGVADVRAEGERLQRESAELRAAIPCGACDKPDEHCAQPARPVGPPSPVDEASGFAFVDELQKQFSEHYTLSDIKAAQANGWSDDCQKVGQAYVVATTMFPVPLKKRDDGLHCECWYGGNICCACGDGDRKLGESGPTCA